MARLKATTTAMLKAATARRKAMPKTGSNLLRKAKAADLRKFRLKKNALKWGSSTDYAPKY